MKPNAKHPHASVIRLAIAAGLAASIAACGGGSSSSSDPTAAAPTPAPTPVPAPAPTTLNGVVATGASLAGATVTVIDASTTTTDPAPVIAGADGSYTVNVDGLTAPFIVKASGTLDGEPTNLVAVVPSVAANAGNTANVTSLTNAIAALIAPAGDISALSTPATLASSVTAQKVTDASALIVNTLKTDPSIASVLGTSFNPLTTPFAADGSGIDSVLDKLAVESSASGVSITNLAAASSRTGVPASVTLTAAQTASPATVPTLPASLAATLLPTAAELAALAKKLQDCLALPLSQRVTLDAKGDVTAVSATCNYAPSDWKSTGRNWAQQVGQFTLTLDQLTGAKVGKASTALVLSALGVTDAKTFKHPYCNTAECVVIRIPLTTASNQTIQSDWMLAKVSGAWNYVGNQTPYTMGVSNRMARYVEMNTVTAAANPTVYRFQNRIESQLRVSFDPSSPGGASNIRAVRWTGPGLPAAGIVTFRSQACGTDDRFAITYQNGSTRAITLGNAVQYWSTTSTSTDFKLSAAKHDGSSLAMPVPVTNTTTVSSTDFSPVEITQTIPAWSVYTAELFYFSSATTTPDTPDEIIYVRNDAPIDTAASAANKPWPSLAQSIQDGFLKPTGANAGGLMSLSSSMSWTAPAGVAVTSSYLFGQNSATVTNAESESASYNLRTRLDYRPQAYGDVTSLGFQFADVGSGASLSSFTQSAGTNPNPRCTSTNVVPLTTASSDYREVGLSFQDNARRRSTAIWYWNN